MTYGKYFFLAAYARAVCRLLLHSSLSFREPSDEIHH